MSSSQWYPQHFYLFNVSFLVHSFISSTVYSIHFNTRNTQIKLIYFQIEQKIYLRHFCSDEGLKGLNLACKLLTWRVTCNYVDNPFHGNIFQHGYFPWFNPCLYLQYFPILLKNFLGRIPSVVLEQGYPAWF